jgi:hypothetical protein
MKIKETFLNLTKKTYPWGFEEDLVNFLPKGFEQDIHGNYFYKLGNSKTVFTCHLDTACKEQVDVKHVIEGNLIKTDGKSILGADDKAGMTIILYLIKHNVPGLYCFFIGEEVGCIGSKAASNDEYFKSYDRMISFDRRGTTSVITHQSARRTCSDKFATALSKELNKFGLEMKPDDTGVYTDSAEFVDAISECTNISVGYYNEHRNTEHQDIQFLEELCKAVVRVDWENLPTARDKTKMEYSNDSKIGRKYTKSYPTVTYAPYENISSRSRDYYDDWYDDCYYNFETTKPKNNKNKNVDSDYFDDLDYYDVETKSKKYYEALKQYIFEDELTREEFDRVRDMYLDLNDPSDMDFYLEMKESL